MVVAAMLIFGALSYNRLGIDLFPNVDFPIVTVTCIYRGASPETLETKVVDKIEEELSTLNGIDELRSVSAENVAQIYAVFNLSKNIDLAAQDVRDKLAAIRRHLPEDMDTPVVEKLDMGALPIMTITIAADMPVAKLSAYAKDVVKARLQSVEGVGSIGEIGLREREIKVWLDKHRLNARRLTVAEIVATLQSKNLEVPGGKVENERQELIVKTMGEVESVEELRQLTLAVIDGAPVRLSDVADVEDGLQDEKVIGRLNGRPAVAFQIRKQSGTNTVKVAAGVREAVEQLRAAAPAGLRIEIPVDVSPFIKESIRAVTFDLIFGAVLATLVILVFLRSFTSTLISAAAIPTSIVATYTVMHALGFTLNNLSALALSLAVGMLIDDAIVVIENIHRHIEMGKSARQAASEATAEIGLAVAATTFSIVAVFVPVSFMEGIIGRFLFQFGITVSAAVIISLFVSFTLTPMLASRWLKREHHENAVSLRISRTLNGLDALYRTALQYALANRVLTLFAGLLSLAAAVWIGTNLKQDFIPRQDKNAYLVDFQVPPGTSLPETKRLLASVEAALEPQKGMIRNLFSTIAADAFEDTTKAQIYVDLEDKNARPRSQLELEQEARELLSKLPGFQRMAVNELPDVSGGGIANQPIQYSLLGSEFDVLASLTRHLTGRMKALGYYIDINSSYEPGKPELRIFPRRDRMESLGVNLAQLAKTLNFLLSGEQVISRYKEGSRQFDVKVRLLATERRYAEDLSDIFVRTLDGRGTAALANLVSTRIDAGPARIYRLNRSRQITLMSELKPGYSQGEAMKTLETEASNILPAGYRGRFQGMSKEMRRAFSGLLQALGLAVVLVYMLLASQFEHFVHPLTIMASVPLAAVGAVGGLWLAGMSLSVFSSIGIIMLMGLVVKNGILIVEFINQRREAGLGLEEAILEAAPVRMRPILMTSACMIGGMVPVALSTGAGSEIRAPMAVAVIGGMITSTFLTLFVVPVLYDLMSRVSAKFTPSRTGAE